MKSNNEWIIVRFYENYLVAIWITEIRERCVCLCLADSTSEIVKVLRNENVFNTSLVYLVDNSLLIRRKINRLLYFHDDTIRIGVRVHTVDLNELTFRCIPGSMSICVSENVSRIYSKIIWFLCEPINTFLLPSYFSSVQISVLN